MTRSWIGSSVIAVLLAACSSSGESSSPDAGEPPRDASSEVDEAGDGAADAGEPPPYDFTVKCAKEPCASALAARGGAHVCAIMTDGAVDCWGSNDSGQLGTGRSEGGALATYAGSPRRVLGIAGATSIAASGHGLAGTTCAVTEGGVVSCFGSDAFGQLGRSVVVDGSQPDPTTVADLRAKSVRLTNTFALAIDTSGLLWSWGDNTAFQLARDTSVSDGGPPNAPKRADRISALVRSSAGTTTNGFVVTDTGDLLSWGGGTAEQLGRVSSIIQDPNPGLVEVAGASSIVTGAGHACALSKGTIHCWGENDAGQLGTGVRAASRSPARALFPEGVYPVAIFAGGDDTCAIDARGGVYCWGANGAGQLGVPVGVDQASPRRIELDEQAVEIAIMDESICVLLRRGSVSCWGDNLVGQLGRGSRDVDLHAVPAPVVFE